MNMPSENPPTEPSAWEQADDGSNQPPKKKRRKWPWVIVGLLVLLLLLVALAPMIASTSPVRGIVVSKINEQLNGKLAVNDWSLGWTSGVKLNGVKIDDEHG